MNPSVDAVCPIAGDLLIMSLFFRDFTRIRVAWDSSRRLLFKVPPIPLKISYDSTEVFIQKAKKHLSEGDIAQCSEKLYGCVKFALKSHAHELSKFHPIKELKSPNWTYAKYKKLCISIATSLGDKKGGEFLNSWGRAEEFHIRGWNMNQIEYDDAKLGIKSMEEFVKQISDLPKTKELAEQIHKGVFSNEFDAVSIAGKVRQKIAVKDFKGALRAMGIKYSKHQQAKIITTNNSVYKCDLRKELIDIPKY